MRILFDSKQQQFKFPFGTLHPGELCTLHIHIPCTVQAKRVVCNLCYESGQHMREVGDKIAKIILAHKDMLGDIKIKIQ